MVKIICLGFYIRKINYFCVIHLGIGLILSTPTATRDPTRHWINCFSREVSRESYLFQVRCINNLACMSRSLTPRNCYTPTAGIEPASPEGRGYLPSPKRSQRVSQPRRGKTYTPKGKPFTRKGNNSQPEGKVV